MEAKLNPTEDRAKVLRAMHTALTFDDNAVQETARGSDTYLFVSEEGRQALRKLFTKFRDQSTVEAARKMFFRHARGNRARGFFHKQGAFEGVLHFAMEEGESPLGPIKVEIEATDIQKVLDWLVPKTENGVVLEANYQPD